MPTINWTCKCRDDDDYCIQDRPVVIYYPDDTRYPDVVPNLDQIVVGDIGSETPPVCLSDCPLVNHDDVLTQPPEDRLKVAMLPVAMAEISRVEIDKAMRRFKQRMKAMEKRGSRARQLEVILEAVAWNKMLALPHVMRQGRIQIPELTQLLDYFEGTLGPLVKFVESSQWYQCIWGLPTIDFLDRNEKKYPFYSAKISRRFK